jgi:hypothetical protein
MDPRHLIAYALIAAMALLAVFGTTAWARRRSEARRIRRGYRPRG